jgi:cytochrome c peroxidase
MNKKLSLSLSLAACATVLAACGGGSTASSPTATVAAGGNAENGKALYTQSTLGPNSAPGCSTCHSLDGSTLVGPTHQGIGTAAASRVPSLSAAAFLEESIRNPNAHVTEGFVEGVMYQNYGTELTDQEIDDLVAYLLTLK